MKKKHSLGYWLMFVLMTLIAFVSFFPFFWMFLSSFKTQSELLSMPPTFFPNNFTTANYTQVFKQMPFTRYYINSLLTSGLNTLVGVISSSLIGYVFAKYEFPYKNVIFLVVLACMMIPYETLMPTVYKMMVGIKWTNSYKVLTIPYFVNIFGIFLMRQFYLDLPDDYLEAAEVDGCSQFEIWARIAMPMANSTTSSLVIFLFMASYNSFMWPLISVDSRKLFTLPVGIASMIWDRGNQYAMLLAAASMIIVPVCILFAFMQRKFIEVMTSGGING